MKPYTGSAGDIVRHVTTYALMGLLGACLPSFTGCVSNRAVEPVAQAVVKKAIKRPMDFVFALSAFGEANNRWPKDQEELAAFIEQSNGELQPIPFDHVEFTQNPDGSLGIDATRPGMKIHATISRSEKPLEKPQGQTTGPRT
jgi:hypothetical protein